MSSKSPTDYLRDILKYLAKASAFTKAGREAFFRDEVVQFAVIRVYEVIGEIVKRLPLELREANPQIDWRALTGFRDFLVHNYEEVVLDLVWAAIEDVPNLSAKIHLLIEDLTQSGSED